MGVQLIQLKPEGRERESGGGNPLIRRYVQFTNEETHILIRLLGMYFPRNWEFS
jgi:hypothetical protein